MSIEMDEEINELNIGSSVMLLTLLKKHNDSEEDP